MTFVHKKQIGYFWKFLILPDISPLKIERDKVIQHWIYKKRGGGNYIKSKYIKLTINVYFVRGKGRRRPTLRNHGFGWPGRIICTLKVTDIISTPLHYNLPRFYSTPRLFAFRLDQLAQAMVTTKDNRSSSLSSVNTKYQKRSHKLQKIQPTAIRKNRSKAPNISG